MVKTKKGKKEIVASAVGGAASSDDEMDSETLKTALDDDDGSVDSFNTKNKKNKQKSSKKSKKKSQLSDEENAEVASVTSGVKKLDVKTKKQSKPNINSVNLGEENWSPSEDEVESKTSKISKKAAVTKKSVFEMLMEDDDDNEPPETRVESEPDDVEEKVVQPDKKSDKNTKKGKKSKRKGRDDEEDLDKVLAEIQAEYSAEPAAVIAPDDLADEVEFSKAKKGKKQQNQAGVAGSDECAAHGGDIEGTVKTAAQKKKEKKERQKREAALAKQRASQEPTQKLSKIEVTDPEVSAAPNEPSVELSETFECTGAPDDQGEVAQQENDAGRAGKKDKKKAGKKDKKAQEEEDIKKDAKKKGGVSAAMVAAMQERLKKIKEEEERLRKLEEERIRQEEERERLRLEAIRLEAERKEKRKQKEAERKARLKAEGKLLTKKQKEDRARAQAMLESLRAQGLEIPDPNEKRGTRPGTRVRPKKKAPGNKEEATSAEVKVTAGNQEEAATSAGSAGKDIIKESWDASDSEEVNGEEDTSQTTSTNNEEKSTGGDVAAEATKEEDEEGSSSEEGSDENSEDGNESDLGSDSALSAKDTAFNPNDPEERRLRAERRIIKRKTDAESTRNAEDLRAAVVCVLGHVDTGKTKILDKLRRTHVQDSEAGGITQQIGATNVPIEAIKEQSKIVRNSTEFEYRLPGLLIIDTPGHESFSNLRNRGSSLCDIAILVVDIMHGLEPQTIESINLLKKKKCPFIVALNKIDRLYDWKVMARRDVRDVIKEQEPNTQLEFNQRVKEVILQFAEQGFNAALFYENPDPKTYISLVPTSAITGEGMGNLLFLIIEFCQKMLAKRLMYSEELQATVLEVKAIPGLGTTIDAILINGRLREGQTMILAGTDGPIVTQIRSLLMPQPLKELRVKNAYVEHKEVKAAQGVKIAAKDLEKAIAGINLLIAHKADEVDICKEEVARDLKSALSHIKLAQMGVYVQASTLGSLEALLEFLRTSKIPVSSIRIGPVVKRDVMKASTMLEHEAQYATILAFDVKVEREAQEMADSLGVKVFQADIIYHLFDKFMAYREELKQKKREQFRSIAVFPCKLRILPQSIFKSRDPIIIGVMVENGIVKAGTPLCVPSKDFVDIGVVTSIESNHKNIESARKGQEICVKIEPIPGESPKMYGRHFDAEDMLVSKISRQSIDACKDYFRDDLIKADWSLMVELKKLFQIL